VFLAASLVMFVGRGKPDENSSERGVSSPQYTSGWDASTGAFPMPTGHADRLMPSLRRVVLARHTADLSTANSSTAFVGEKRRGRLRRPRPPTRGDGPRRVPAGRR